MWVSLLGKNCSVFPYILVTAQISQIPPLAVPTAGAWPPQIPSFPWFSGHPSPQTSVEVLLTALPPRMFQENAAWLTTWFGNMLLAVFYAFYQVFLTLYWLGPWRAQFSKVEVNNFTPENVQPGLPSSKLPESQYSWALEAASQREVAQWPWVEFKAG